MVIYNIILFYINLTTSVDEVDFIFSFQIFHLKIFYKNVTVTYCNCNFWTQFFFKYGNFQITCTRFCLKQRFFVEQMTKVNNTMVYWSNSNMPGEQKVGVKGIYHYKFFIVLFWVTSDKFTLAFEKERFFILWISTLFNFL